MIKLNKYFLLAALVALPTSVLAVSEPVVLNAPGKIDADFFTLQIEVDPGSKVSVIGGVSNTPPATDGQGDDALDGVVEVRVGLAQNKDNVFSINAQLNGEFSNSITVSIKEEEDTSGGGSSQGDVTPPEAPLIDKVEGPLEVTEYTITGSSEAYANIYVKETDGTKVNSTQANSNGLFSVEVPLEPGKTNRFNVSAEDAAYNIGRSTQVVIQVLDSAAEDKVVEEAQESSEKKEEKELKVVTLPFIDVQGHWAKSFIQKIYEAGIVKGKTATQFAPNDPITRAELLKVALKAFDHKVESNIEETSFPDVDENDWYAPFVEAAVELEIASGFDDGFKPNRQISRAAALKILLEASGLNIGDGIVEFTDVKSSDWFRKYVAYAKENNIVGGYSDNTFRPNDTITRAEVAKIVVRIMELIQSKNEPTI